MNQPRTHTGLTDVSTVGKRLRYLRSDRQPATPKQRKPSKVIVTARIDPELKKKLTAWAKLNGQTLSKFIAAWLGDATPKIVRK